MEILKYPLSLMTFAITIEGAVFNSRNNICPKPLKQTLVPWVDQLYPNRQSLSPEGNIGRLYNYSFVLSPNLKVCVLYICAHIKQINNVSYKNYMIILV